MVKLVIFDLDGVLVDACEWHRIALNEALKEVCNYEISLSDHRSTFNGLPTKVKLEKLIEEGKIQQKDHDAVYKLKQKKTVEIINRNADEREEKINLIMWLKKKNINVACFTNSIRETATLMLKKTGVYDMLELIITNEDVTRPKPDPEGYNKVLKYFNYTPEHVMIVEDSIRGVQAAISSGCKVYKVADASDVNIENLRGFICENFNTNGW
jgi:HAD superfamily hydrolase (TIGR01509 family)